MTMVPLKKKFLRDNHASFMSKRLRKPKMKRSELKLTYLKIPILILKKRPILILKKAAKCLL